MAIYSGMFADTGEPGADRPGGISAGSGRTKGCAGPGESDGGGTVLAAGAEGF